MESGFITIRIGMPVLNKIFNILFILMLTISSVNALELGQLKVDSYLNEPLNANFSLSHIESDHPGDVNISLADQNAYKAIGLLRPPFLNKIKFKITADTDSRHIVNVSTQQRIKEPILDLLVKVTGKQSSVTRLFTIMLDPRDIAATNQIQTVSQTDISSKKPVLDVTQRKTVDSSPKRIKVVNDSISMLAQNSDFHDKYSVYQIMRAYYLLNEDAFRQGNINELKAGVTLIVPDEELISQVSRQKSINFVYSVSKNNPFEKTASIQPEEVTDSTKSVLSILTPEPENTAPPEVKEQLIQSNKSAPAEVSQDMGEEVNSPGNVTQEVKALSSIVERQNLAMKEHSSILQKIDSDLEQKSEQLDRVDERLSALEGDGLSLAVADTNKLLNSNSDELSSRQQKIIIVQQEKIDELQLSLTQKLAEIDHINDRLNTLESQSSDSATVESLTNVEGPPPPVIINEPDKVGIQQQTYTNAVTWGVALIVLLFLLNREIIWRRRLKQIDQEAQIEIPIADTPEKPVVKDTSFQSAAKKDNELKTVDETIKDQSFNEAIVEEIHYEPVIHDSRIDEMTMEQNHDDALLNMIEYEPVDDIRKDEDDEVELDFNLEFSEDDPGLTDQLPTIDEIEGDNDIEGDNEIDDPSISNLKIADQKFELAVSNARNYKNDYSENLQSKSEEEKKDPLILYSEIDVLIAYQLYEEALELVVSSREDFVGNKSDLDIRELEILGYLKNDDLFFPMFDELKEELAKEYPVEWKKIVELSEQMPPRGPQLTAAF